MGTYECTWACACRSAVGRAAAGSRRVAGGQSCAMLGKAGLQLFGSFDFEFLSRLFRLAR